MNSAKKYILQHQKMLYILCGITALNFMFGFDARFTIINCLWVLINLNFPKFNKTKNV